MRNLIGRFSIPALPKPWYLKVQELKEGLGLDDRQCILLALWALCELGAQDPTRVREAAQHTRERYPYRKREKGPSQ
jgi:hypothetical protein